MRIRVAVLSGVLFTGLGVLSEGAYAQSMGDLFKKKSDSTVSTISDMLKGNKRGSLSASEVAAGLKEALELGTAKSVAKLNVTDGYFANAAIKILMPPEAEKIEKTLRSIGLGRQVDQAILSMNRAAEDAAAKAAPIFVTAIKGMSIDDAFGILRGNNDAATKYLQLKTSDSLTAAFRPVIDASLQKVNATKHWNAVVTRYNQIAGAELETDLTKYVTDRALNGMFLQLAEEEAAIRKDPINRTSELLKKVFGSN